MTLIIKHKIEKGSVLMTQLLEVSNLNKSYTKSDFNLSDISLSIAPGEVLGLIGKMAVVNPR